MDKTEVSTTIKSWPTPQDYNEAVQNLHLNLKDPELRAGEVESGHLGIPRPITGAFASVYRVGGKEADWALRCFLRNIPDVQWRYEKISDFVQHDSLTYTVAFDFQPAGIKVGALWYPVLKMEWVDGETLDNYLRAQHAIWLKPTSQQEVSRRIGALAEKFKQMCIELNKAGIAHGDLQHGNIIVRQGELFLVDYDGMYVPSMRGSLSNEIGHRNYQHPLRSAEDFGPYLDNFSAWVIYSSLKALSIDFGLFDRLGAAEDCLLFRQDDFRLPTHSFVFRELEGHKSEEINGLAQFVRWLLTLPPSEILSIESYPKIPGDLEPLSDEAAASRTQQHEIIQAHYATGALPSTTHASTTHRNRPNIPEAGAIEPELLIPPPRQIDMDRAREMGELLGGGQDFVNTRNLVREGKPAIGIIIDKKEHSGLTAGVLWQQIAGALTGTYNTHSLHYSYADSVSKQQEFAQIKVDPITYRRAQVGDKVTVLYMPGAELSTVYKYCGIKARTPGQLSTARIATVAKTKPTATVSKRELADLGSAPRKVDPPEGTVTLFGTWMFLTVVSSIFVWIALLFGFRNEPYGFGPSWAYNMSILLSPLNKLWSVYWMALGAIMNISSTLAQWKESVRLYRNGYATKATVIALDRTSSTIFYRYHDAFLHMDIEDSMRVSAARVANVNHHDEFAVLYDPGCRSSIIAKFSDLQVTSSTAPPFSPSVDLIGTFGNSMRTTPVKGPETNSMAFCLYFACCLFFSVGILVIPVVPYGPVSPPAAICLSFCLLLSVLCGAMSVNAELGKSERERAVFELGHAVRGKITRLDSRTSSVTYEYEEYGNKGLGQMQIAPDWFAHVHVGDVVAVLVDSKFGSLLPKYSKYAKR